MARGLQVLVRIVCVVLLTGGALLVAPPPGRAGALASFAVGVQDENGVPRSDATVAIRYRFGPQQWQLFASGKTGIDGWVVLQLDPMEDYVVQVYYTPYNLQEHWSYGYIGPQDWSRGSIVFRRNRPWIDQVTMATQPWSVGLPQQVTVTIAHGYRDMDYDFRVKVAMVVDDDGAAPYLAEVISDPQIFYNGIEPFQLSYAPPSEGQFLVRFIVYTKFEVNNWEVSDDGGWRWQLQVRRDPDLPAVMRGTVYHDLNHDGIRTSGESPLAGARVLLAQGETIVADVLTGSDGGYEFRAPAGRYQVKIGAAPYGYRVPQARDVTCIPGQVLNGLDLGLETWYCHLPIFLAIDRP